MPAQKRSPISNTEYVLILALVAVALFGVIQFTGLGDSLGSAVTRVVTKVNAQS